MNGNEGLLFEYNSVMQEINGIYRNVGKRLGLSESAFWILYALRTSAPPMTQSGLCTYTCMPKQTVNSALKSFERDGLIELEGPGGAKGKTLRLTKAGEKLAAETADRVVRAESEAFARMGREESRKLIELERRLASLLSESVGAVYGKEGEK